MKCLYKSGFIVCQLVRLVREPRPCPLPPRLQFRQVILAVAVIIIFVSYLELKKKRLNHIMDSSVLYRQYNDQIISFKQIVYIKLLLLETINRTLFEQRVSRVFKAIKEFYVSVRNDVTQARQFEGGCIKFVCVLQCVELFFNIHLFSRNYISMTQNLYRPCIIIAFEHFMARIWICCMKQFHSELMS